MRSTRRAFGKWCLTPFRTDSQRLSGNLAGWYRLRTGDYRVRFRVAGDTVIVDKIGHRSDVYEGY